MQKKEGTAWLETETADQTYTHAFKHIRAYSNAHTQPDTQTPAQEASRELAGVAVVETALLVLLCGLTGVQRTHGVLERVDGIHF